MGLLHPVHLAINDNRNILRDVKQLTLTLSVYRSVKVRYDTIEEFNADSKAEYTA